MRGAPLPSLQDWQESLCVLSVTHEHRFSADRNRCHSAKTVVILSAFLARRTYALAGGTYAAGVCIGPSARKNRGPQDDMATRCPTLCGAGRHMCPPVFFKNGRVPMLQSVTHGHRLLHSTNCRHQQKTVVILSALFARRLCTRWRHMCCQRLHRSFGPQKPRVRRMTKSSCVTEWKNHRNGFRIVSFPSTTCPSCISSE